MFRRKYNNDNNQSSISLLVDKKTRMLKSKIDYALHGEHDHYFNKKQSLDPTVNPKCKVCGMLLSDFMTQKKFETLNREIREKYSK